MAQIVRPKIVRQPNMNKVAIARAVNRVFFVVGIIYFVMFDWKQYKDKIALHYYLSFPRRRESTSAVQMDTRLRGYDTGLQRP